MRVIYLPLEGYRERYTELLTTWTMNRLKDRGADIVPIFGKSLGRGIKVGRVLDAHGRAHYALTQMAALAEFLRRETLCGDDVIYLDDMFTPGYEALPYIFDQDGEHPRIYARCHAQSVDVYDFTFPMIDWMRRYEELVDRTCTAILVNTPVHIDHLRAAGFRAPIKALGLPFDRESVRGLAGPVLPLRERPRRVIWSSRWDTEKQPLLFLELARRFRREAEFVVCTGSDELRSNDPELVSIALAAERDGLVTIVRGADKPTYYKLMGSSRAHFLASLQDYTSYVLLEASALGTPTLAPAFRSFPHELSNDRRRLYVPWSMDDAAEKLAALLDFKPKAPTDAEIAFPSQYHNDTLDRIADLFLLRP